jgi:hypothetical protein
MSIETTRKALLWCTIINFGVLFVWFFIFVLAHQWMYVFVGKWFHMSVELFDAMNLAGIGLYKLGIILFNLVPYIALRIVE